MTKLPVIVGFGGFNAAGRASFHQAYQRMVIGSLSDTKRQETLVGLAVMMGRVHFSDGSYRDNEGTPLSVNDIENRFGSDILENTLIRRIGKQFFDVDNIPTHQSLSLSKLAGQSMTFTFSKRKLPEPLPSTWQVTELDEKHVTVVVDGDSHIKLETTYSGAVKAAGQLPDGFDPATLYTSRFHPRGLQLSVIGASDALHSMGIDWQAVTDAVAPDEIGVYSTSVMSQLDDNGLGGLLKARLKGERVTTKQLALGFNSMPADFINAYVLGSIGSTASITGACASFLYNLRAGIEDIQAGRRRVVMVGSSEAPITSEIIDGYATMGALATDDKLAKLDDAGSPDYRRSSRPFSDNCGFTLAESSQYVILMDDELAVELGADIHGAVTDVFVNADGYKKSISAPGPGNYLTFAKAVASAVNLLGEDVVRKQSFIQAHGSSTPQNRVTESEIFDRVARAFDINDWPVTAVKSYVGHSLAPASGDQLINTLGIFNQGILPGIKTIDYVANDVYQERLAIALEDVELEHKPAVAFLNSKGFGGNNATACVISPEQTKKMLLKRYGPEKMQAHALRCAETQKQAESYQQSALHGDFNVHYHFGQNMIDDEQLIIDKAHIEVPGFGQFIDLTNENLYKDMV